jgi:hypothetical protein
MSAGEFDGQPSLLLRRGNANKTGEAFVSSVCEPVAALTTYFDKSASQKALRRRRSLNTLSNITVFWVSGASQSLLNLHPILPAQIGLEVNHANTFIHLVYPHLPLMNLHVMQLIRHCIVILIQISPVSAEALLKLSSLTWLFQKLFQERFR